MSNIDDSPLEEKLPASPRLEGGLAISEPSARRGLEALQPNVLTLSTGNDEAPASFSISQIVSAVLHRFWVGFPLGVVLAGVAVAAMFYFVEDQYRSFAWLRLSGTPEYIAFPGGTNRGFAGVQVELIRSPLVLEAASQSDEVRELPEMKAIAGKEDPGNWIKQRLSVQAVGRSAFYEVAVVTGNAESSAALVTAIVQSYMDFYATFKDSRQQKLKELLERELRFWQRDCELKREVVRDLARQAAGKGFAEIEEPGGQTVHVRTVVLGVFEEKLVEAEVKAEFLKAHIALYREALAASIEISDQEVGEMVEQDVRLVAWKGELAAAEESLKLISPNPSPLRKTLETKIADLTQRIAERRETLGPQLKALSLEQVNGQRESHMRQMVKELEREQGLIQFFRGRVAEDRALLGERGDLSLEIKLAQSDLDMSQTIYDQISHRMTAMDTEARAPSQVEVMQAAKIPSFPEGTSLNKKIMVIGLAAFLFPLGLLTGYELMVKRIYEADQLRQVTGIEFVGEVSSLPVRRRIRSDRAFERQAYILEESVDSLRTALSVTDRNDTNKVVVVCSAISGEGKTHLSAQLALSWSRGHAGSVLLIDADMRSPSIHEMFDIDMKPGLVEVLRGSATLQEAIVTDWGEGIHILPAGRLESLHPDRLIASERFIRLLEVAREHYSRIIIDVPPILSAHETLLIARMADGALLCTLRDFSRTQQFQEAHQRLTRAEVNVMGAVLNGTPTQSYVYNYGSYS